MIGKDRHKSNDPDEAYARNSAGCQEVRTFLKQFNLDTAYTGGNNVRKAEANTKGSIVHHCRAKSALSARRDPGGHVGVGEHGTEKEKRPELGNILCFLNMQVGLFNKTKKV